MNRNTRRRTGSPESPNTHKRIMARNRMRRYRIRKRERQAPVQSSVVYSAPPHSPVLYDSLPITTPPPSAPPPFPPLYVQHQHPAAGDNYDPPLISPHNQQQPHQDLGREHRPPRAQQVMRGSPAGARTLAHASSSSDLSSSGPGSMHRAHTHGPHVPPQRAGSSSPHGGLQQCLLPGLHTPHPRSIDPEAALAFQQACENMALSNSRPVNVHGVLRDVIDVIPPRCDTTECIEFATRVCRILSVHMA